VVEIISLGILRLVKDLIMMMKVIQMIMMKVIQMIIKTIIIIEGE